MLSQEKGFDFTDGELELLTSSEAPKTVDSRNLSRTVEPTQARPCMTCTEKKKTHIDIGGLTCSNTYIRFRQAMYGGEEESSQTMRLTGQLHKQKHAYSLRC